MPLTRTGHDSKASNCTLALAYGRRIIPPNSILGHQRFRRTLVKQLVDRETSIVDAVVPIPAAGVYLAQCWNEMRPEVLWNAFGEPPIRRSMFRIEDAYQRERYASKKVGTVKNHGSFSAVILIDEAVLTGITMLYAIRALRLTGVTRILVRTLLPPVIRSCPYEVIKHNPEQTSPLRNIPAPRGRRELARFLGADDFNHLDESEILQLAPRQLLCVDCIRDYPNS